jgi:hypothetical protein
LASKRVSLEQAEQKRQQAIAFLDRLGESDKADEFRNMTTAEYVSHKGLQVQNRNRRRWFIMATGSTKTDLQNAINEVSDLLDSAYAPESSREDLVAAISNALDVLDDVAEEPEDGDEDSDIDSGDDDANGD